jgi:hypothetical protein
MKKEHVVLFVSGLLLGASAYLSSGLWYFGLGIGIIALGCGFFWIVPSAQEFMKKSRIRHECYLFIHGFLVTLSVCMSLEKAFEVATQNLSKEFHELDPTLNTMSAKEKVEYLATYFSSDLYRMFLSILRLYLDRGGDVLKLSGELTAEASRVEETEQSYQKQASRKLFSFAFLWAMAVIIVVFIRFGLSSFFLSMQHSLSYIGSLAVFYVFLMGSLVYYAKAHTGSLRLLPMFRRKRK